MSVYAVSDLHGMYPLWEQIKAILKPEDRLYVLGDCGDRGPDGWKIIKEVYAHLQCVYIKGNHEDMLIKAMHGDVMNCFYNGGRSTFDAWKEEGERGWAKRLSTLPTSMFYTNTKNETILMSHAGYTPDVEFLFDEDLIWSRSHFEDEWPKGKDNVYILHGHTPIISGHLPGLERDLSRPPQAYKYCNGHKIDIDCGSFITKATVLLNLDTWEETIITC